jgi:TPR repeat protein
MDYEIIFEDASGHYEREEYSISFELFALLASKGHSPSKNNLGVMYEHGLGIKKDTDLAMKWYKNAAKDMEVASFSNIADLYIKLGNRRAAFYWYRKAIDQGDGDAALCLSKILLKNKVNKKYLKMAKKLLVFARSTSSSTLQTIEEASVLLKDFENNRKQ